MIEPGIIKFLRILTPKSNSTTGSFSRKWHRQSYLIPLILTSTYLPTRYFVDILSKTMSRRLKPSQTTTLT